MSGQLTGRETLDELRQIVGQMRQDIEWLLEGRVSSKNIREVGGYNVNATDLKSKDGDVGLSSANDAVDPVRLWAGGTDKNTAPWRVTKSGKMKATGATIESSASYPKIVLDPTGNLLGAYISPGRWVAIYPVGSTGTPQLTFSDDSTSSPASSVMWTQPNSWAAGVTSFTIDSTKFIRLTPGGTSPFTGNSWILSDGDITIFDFANLYSIGDSQTLQQALDNKANKSAISGTVYVSATSGGVANIPITFTNGVRTS